MSEAAKALGNGGVLSFRGKTYKLKPFDMDGIAAFSAWLENRAWEAVERTKTKCDAEAYSERHTAVSRLVAAGEFDYGGVIAGRAALTIPGQKWIYQWMLATAPENHAAGLEINERLVEDIFAEKMEEAIARMNEANADPNRQAPPAQAGANPSPSSPPNSPENPGATDPGKSAS